MGIRHQNLPQHAAPSQGIVRGARGLLLAAALAAGLAAGAVAAPQPQTVFRSIDTPCDLNAPFFDHPIAYHPFHVTATTAWGLSAAGNNFNGTPTGIQLQLGAVTASVPSSAELWAEVQAGPHPYAFTDLPAHHRAAHVAAIARNAGVAVTLLEIAFSTPVQGTAFIGAGLSDHAGYSGSRPSQRFSLDGGSGIDVVGVPTTSIANPVYRSFGVLSATPFSRVGLYLPVGSDNDNAALASIMVACAAAPVPEPQALLLGLAGLPVLPWRRRRLRDGRTRPGPGRRLAAPHAQAARRCAPASAARITPASVATAASMAAGATVTKLSRSRLAAASAPA